MKIKIEHTFDSDHDDIDEVKSLILNQEIVLAIHEFSNFMRAKIKWEDYSEEVREEIEKIYEKFYSLIHDKTSLDI